MRNLGIDGWRGSVREGINRFTQKRRKCYDRSAAEKLGTPMESKRRLRGRGTMGVGTLAMLIGCAWRYNHPRGQGGDVAHTCFWTYLPSFHFHSLLPRPEAQPDPIHSSPPSSSVTYISYELIDLRELLWYNTFTGSVFFTERRLMSSCPFFCLGKLWGPTRWLHSWLLPKI